MIVNEVLIDVDYLYFVISFFDLGNNFFDFEIVGLFIDVFVGLVLVIKIVLIVSSIEDVVGVEIFEMDIFLNLIVEKLIINFIFKESISFVEYNIIFVNG